MAISKGCIQEITMPLEFAVMRNELFYSLKYNFACSETLLYIKPEMNQQTTLQHDR